MLAMMHEVCAQMLVSEMNCPVRIGLRQRGHQEQ
jgi:hypothetical protein